MRNNLPQPDCHPDSAIRKLLSDPSNTEDVAKAYWLLGLEAEKQFDWEDAVEKYLQVVDLAPTDTKVRYFGHNNLAYSLLHLNCFDDARLHCLAAIEVDDNRHNAYKNLGLAYEALMRPTDAAACFLAASFRNGADKRAWLHLQKLLEKHPGLLAQEPELTERMKIVRDEYEARGGVPALN